MYLARRNEPSNQIVERDDSAKIFLVIYDSSKTKPSSAQLLHNPVGRLILRSGYNAPDVIAQRLVSVFVQQDVEDIDQSSRLAVRRNYRQTINTGRGGDLHCFQC